MKIMHPMAAAACLVGLFMAQEARAQYGGEEIPGRSPTKTFGTAHVLPRTLLTTRGPRQSQPHRSTGGVVVESGGRDLDFDVECSRFEDGTSEYRLGLRGQPGFVSVWVSVEGGPPVHFGDHPVSDQRLELVHPLGPEGTRVLEGLGELRFLVVRLY